MDDMQVRAQVPADIEAPDKIVWGLTARQVAVLAAAAALGWLLLKATGGRLPLQVTLIGGIPFAGAAVALALGRRDGLSLDAWLLAALRYRRRPRRLVPAPEGIAPAPAWAPPAAGEQPLSVLRLPVQAIRDDGLLELGDSSAVLVAASTVNVGLRTGAEQVALVAGYARWLHSLTGPVQIVVSSRRVELTGHAQRIAAAAGALPHPALGDAALDYAGFLAELAAQREPLWRTVTIACTARAGRSGAAEAARRAAHTAATLAGLGVATQVLDGSSATAVLTAAVDPYQSTDASWPRTAPGRPVTGRYLGEQRP
ncbi:PrgI family mobile element protein [Actinoplanes sp. CA-030573]|uniref:PrgI family mobile element protein n=1 Tax=Actinoplanes sp. CA-030573 TaxID=3239898 RepID=UPI003D8E9EE5